MKQFDQYFYVESPADVEQMMMTLVGDHNSCVNRALYIGLDTETKPKDGRPQEDALRWWGEDPGYPFLYIVGWSPNLGTERPVYFLIPEEYEYGFARIVDYANQFTHKEIDEEGVRPIEWVMFNRTFDQGMVEFSRGLKILGTTHEVMTVLRVACFLPDWWDDKRLKAISEKFLSQDASAALERMNAYKTHYESERGKALTAKLRAIKSTKKAYGEYLENGWELPYEVKQVLEEWKREWPELTYAMIPQEILYPYAGNDVRLTLWLFFLGMKMINERGTLHIYEQEQELYLNNIREQTIFGWTVDRDKLQTAKSVSERRMKELKEKLAIELDFDGCPTISDDVKKKGFNPNSNDQMLKLFAHKGLHLPDLQASTLMKWREKDGAPTPWKEMIDDFQSHKLYMKLHGTYVEPLLHWSQWDGKCHPSIRTDGAYTGRQSMQNPPLQTIPKKEVPEFNIRDFFTASSPEYRLWMFDYSGMEVAVFGEYCRDPIMLDALKKGADFHSMLSLKAFAPARTIVANAIKLMVDEGRLSAGEGYEALEVLHVEHRVDHVLLEKVKHYLEHEAKDKAPFKKYKKLRQAAKIGMFAILYGAGPDALSEQMTEGSGVYISLAEAAEFKQSFYNLYVGAWHFTQAVQEKITMRHAVATIVNHGRQYGWLRNMYGRLYLMEPRDAYKGVNYLVQGTCADLLKRKIIAIHKLFKKLGVKSRIVLSIHDELVFELHKSEEQLLVPQIRAIMEDNPEFEAVQLKAEASYCKGSWASKITFDGNWEQAEQAV